MSERIENVEYRNTFDLYEEKRKRNLQQAVLKILQSEKYISEELLQKVMLKMGV